jgi:hypothetical protein
MVKALEDERDAIDANIKAEKLALAQKKEQAKSE